MRITDLMKNNTLLSTLNRHQLHFDKTERELATGSKIQFPSSDPVGAASQMLYRGRLAELEQYERNVGEAKDRLNLMDGQLDRVGEIFQRMRYLTVQAANGTNSNFELKEAVAKEINQHLLALIDIANTKDATGRALFGGSVIERDPFLPIFSHLQTAGIDQGNAVIGVQYQGDIQVQSREIERHETMEITLPGNRVFWGTNMSIASNKDSSGYVAQGDQLIAINGVRIRISAGDTINDIIDKINTAPVEVRASKGSQDDIILTSKSPHQIWLEDLEGGTVLQDLGLIDGANPEPPNNYSPTATVSGLSIFEVVIMLRDDLIKGDIKLVGGRDLEALDSALENILRYRAEVGARVNRLEQHEKRIAWDTTYTKELLAKNESVDVVQAIVDLKWLEAVHAYALRVGAGIIKQTLMDFLR
ncbi:MAG: flagellar hook-associated protein 3 [Leptospiraceae bacterium]|nr:flagellar hook-associated protein 3 [Leptospiraceae bacterium]